GGGGGARPGRGRAGGPPHPARPRAARALDGAGRDRRRQRPAPRLRLDPPPVLDPRRRPRRRERARARRRAAGRAARPAHAIAWGEGLRWGPWFTRSGVVWGGARLIHSARLRRAVRSSLSRFACTDGPSSDSGECEVPFFGDEDTEPAWRVTDAVTEERPPHSSGGISALNASAR